jgi:MFS family permease
MLQGAAIGGEVPGAWVFVSEHVPSKYVSFACAALTSGLTGGIFLGAMVALAINTAYTPAEILAYGWRIPFIAGGIFGIVAVMLRQWLHETPVFQAMQQDIRRNEIPLKRVLIEQRPAVLLTALVSWVLAASIVTMILMTPTLLQTVFKVPPTLALKANGVATVCLSIGCLFFGALAGRFGLGRVMSLGSLGLVISALLLYQQVSQSQEHLLLLYGFNGFFVGIIALAPTVGVLSFPPEVRFSGLSFSYNVTYAVLGGLTPIFVSLLIPFSSMTPALYVALLGLLNFGIGLYLQKKSL